MKKRGNLLIKLAACAGFVIALYSIISQQLQTNKLREELSDLETRVVAAADANDELTYMLSIAGTDEYYERIARDKLGYHDFGETVFVNDQKD